MERLRKETNVSLRFQALVLIIPRCLPVTSTLLEFNLLLYTKFNTKHEIKLYKRVSGSRSALVQWMGGD